MGGIINNSLSSRFAGIIQDPSDRYNGWISQGLKNQQSLAVLRNSKSPAALVEIGFASHPVDGLNLKDNTYLDRVALGIARGIREALVSGVMANGASNSK